MDERARAQAEAFTRERRRAEAVLAAQLEEKKQTEEDHRLAQELQTEEWHQAAARRAAEQAGPAVSFPQHPADVASQQLQGEIARLKAEIEERKRVVALKIQTADDLRVKAGARRQDAETMRRIWEGRALGGTAITA